MEYVEPFLIGGSVIAGAKLASKYMGPAFAPLIGGMPTGIIAAFFLNNNKNKRIYFNGYIDNIQASWVKLGLSGVDILLNSGVNDLGGTLMNENISRAAGAVHGQELDKDSFSEFIFSKGRTPVIRDTLYRKIKTYSETKS